MKESHKTQAIDSTQGATENPRPAWSKPTIRVMTVSFTQSGSPPNNPGAESAADAGGQPWNTAYVPPTS